MVVVTDHMLHTVCCVTLKTTKSPDLWFAQIETLRFFDNINIFTEKYKQFKCTLIDHFLNQRLNWAVGSLMMEWAIVIG